MNLVVQLQSFFGDERCQHSVIVGDFGNEYKVPVPMIHTSFWETSREGIQPPIGADSYLNGKVSCLKISY